MLKTGETKTVSQKSTKTPRLRVHLYRESYQFWRKIRWQILAIWLFRGFYRFFGNIMVYDDVFGGPNHFEPEKKSFLLLKPDFAAPKPSKTT